MVTRYKLFASLILAAVLGGCTSITPAGPAVYVRNQNGLYPVSFTWETNQRSLRADSVKPVIQVGYSQSQLNEYAMTQDVTGTNLWTGYIPVPKGVNVVNYRIKMNFLYEGFPKPGKDCRLSGPYQLQVIDP